MIFSIKGKKIAGLFTVLFRSNIMINKQSTIFTKAIYEECKNLNTYHIPHFPMALFPGRVGGLLQTVCFKHNVYKSDVPIINERVVLENGGTIGLDFFCNVENIFDEVCEKTIVVFFPPVGSCTSNAGLNAIIAHHVAQDPYKYRVVQIQYQGTAGFELCSENIPGSGYIGTNDVEKALDKIRDKWKTGVMIPVCFCYGCAYFTKFISSKPNICKTYNIIGAVCVAHGLSLRTTVLNGTSHIFGFPSQHVVNIWKKNIFPKSEAFVKKLEEQFPNFSYKELLSAKTCTEWDRATLSLYNYKTIEEMYDFCDSVDTLENLHNNIPVMIFINAEDDPICPASRITQSKVIRDSPSAIIITTKYGGHLGFNEGFFSQKNNQWIKYTILNYVRALNKYQNLVDKSIL